MKAIYRIAALSLILGLMFTSCKEDEEKYVIDNDLFTRHFNHGGFEKVHNWEGVELNTTTTTVDRSTNAIVSISEGTTNLANQWISFSDYEFPYPVHHTVETPGHQIEKTHWRPINNDRLMVTSEYLLEPFPTVDFYMDIVTEVLGPDSLFYYPPSSADDSVLIGVFMWDSEILKLIIEKEEEDDEQTFHFYKEYIFSRLVPQEHTIFDKKMEPKVTGEYEIHKGI